MMQLSVLSCGCTLTPLTTSLPAVAWPQVPLPQVRGFQIFDFHEVALIMCYAEPSRKREWVELCLEVTGAVPCVPEVLCVPERV